jgi:anaerobic magnesium-protoporphyrin IX monomethyl ester cyclase
MKDIILVQPKTGKWDKISFRPPDSLLSIAAVPVSEGFSVKIIDTRVDKDWKSTLKASLKKKPICVGVTSMTGEQINYALEISNFVKATSAVPVVWGGVHASLLPESTLTNPAIDYLIQGEGDYSFFDLVKSIDDEKLPEKIDGVCYKKDGKLVINRQTRLISNLDTLPPLPRHLIDLRDYYALDIKGISTTVMTSRGCPGRCAFCYNTAFFKNCWRGMSSKRVINDLKDLFDKYPIKGILFEDDNFCVNLNRYKEILAGIRKEKLDFEWGLNGVRIDTLAKMEDGLLRESANLGCRVMDVGIESGSPRMLDLMKKDIRIKDILSVNGRLKKFKFYSKFTFIGGYPTETRTDLQMTLDLMKKLVRGNPRLYTPFFIFNAYPGTQSFDLAVKYGLKAPKTLEEWAGIDCENAMYFYPWLSKKRIKLLQMLEFVPNFANINSRIKIQKKLTRMLFDVYHPIAKFRFEHDYYGFPIDKFFYYGITSSH